MSALAISSEERTELETLAKAARDVKTALRLRVVLALAKGMSSAHVAEVFLLSEDTVRKWRHRYERRTLFPKWLVDQHKGYNGKLTEEQLAAVSQFVDESFVAGAIEVVAFISSTFGITYTLAGATKLLHRLGFVYKYATPVPGKLDEAAQAAFAQEYKELRDNLPEDEVILFADGCHPTHNTERKKVWRRKGTEKQVKTNTGRKRLNINGALCVESMEATAYFSDTINAEETLHFFDQVRLDHPDKSTIHIIVDNARYYKNKDVKTYLERPECPIDLIFLPPYSPNLNLIERLWHFMHRDIIGVKHREKFAEFEADIHAFFDHFSDYEPRLRSAIGTEMHLIQLT
jgi:transposase